MRPPSIARIQNGNGDKTFKTKFDSHTIVFPKVNFSPTNFDVDMQTQAGNEEIYYDEIVYYDGGGVEGYGD